MSVSDKVLVAMADNYGVVKDAEHSPRVKALIDAVPVFMDIARAALGLPFWLIAHDSDGDPYCRYCRANHERNCTGKAFQLALKSLNDYGEQMGFTEDQ